MVAPKQLCRYAIVRFVPHVETGEFANIGVVLVAPKAGFLDFKVESRRHARVTSFFDTLEPEDYRRVVANLRKELTRICLMAQHADYTQPRLELGRAEPADYLFDELTRRREGIVGFSEVRTLLTSDPRASLEQLFGYYVERNFVTQRYRETVLEERLKSWLDDWQLAGKFARRQFDDGIYKATFPFVATDPDGRASKVIKPFFLGQKDPTAIIDHGVKWRTSVVRLRRGGHLPNDVLFAVEGPTAGDPVHQAAYEETVASFREHDIRVVPFDKKDEIRSYARQ